ncbi:MAG TPA: PAS domain S-box protein, partial [Chroococcidiopsis sp.]
MRLPKIHLSILFMIARRINQFLSQIIQSIQPMVAGTMSMGQRPQPTPLPTLLETNELAIAFNQMDEQLRNSFVALSEKEERFRTLIDNIPGIIYRCQNDEHWTMEFISDSVNELLGYPAADFINNQVRSFASIIDPGDRQYVHEVTQLAIRNQQPYRIEYRLVDHDGKTRWVIERGKGTFDAQGNLLHLDGAIFDVTEQRQARKALQQKEEMIHAIINAIPDLLIRTRIDGVELDILGNTSFSVEHPRIESQDSTAQTKHVKEYLPPDLAQQRIDMILRAITANQLQRYEQHLQGENNNSRYEEVRVSPINSNEALVIIRDITETKNIEEAMQELSVANRIQANMLPDYDRLCERIPQIDLVATMIPAKDVGGDFFDVFALDHRYLCIAIGDVSGKGMPAALFMVRA